MQTPAGLFFRLAAAQMYRVNLIGNLPVLALVTAGIIRNKRLRGRLPVGTRRLTAPVRDRSMISMVRDSDEKPTSPERLRERYLANLAALYRKDEDLATRIDALPFASARPVEEARDGNATAKLTTDDGREVYAHSRYRPVEETEKFVESLPPTDNPTFFVSGFGLGYHAAVLERQHDRPIVVVAEEDLGLIKSALCVQDLSRPIGEGRLIFLTRPDRTVLHEKLNTCNAALMLGVQFVTPPYARRCGARFHDEMRRLLADFLAVTRLHIVTLLRNARITFKNIALNLPSYVARPGVEELTGRAAGYPAIIVAAGPSLARNLDQLGALRDRAVLIAVQTVFKLLNALNIRPHFVTSLDFHEVSAEFFRGVEDVGDCTLVAEPKATWHVLDVYPGGKRVLHHHFCDTLLGRNAPHRGELRAGSTVAHLALYLAQHLGCDPIIFVGQDLAFTDGVFYLPGSPIEKTWEPELNRFNTVEMKQWERIARNRPILRTVQDVHGRDTYTDDLLFTYAEQFKNDFAAAPQQVIQASEGGMALAGMDVMPLREAARRFCTRSLPTGAFEDAGAPPAAQLREQTCAELAQRQAELKHLQDVAREMRGLLEKLETLIDRPAEFNRVIVRVDALRTLIHKYPEMYRLVVEISATAELRRYTADRRMERRETETRASARQRLRRDRDFVESFIDGTEFVERVLTEATGRVREQLT